MRRKVSFWYQFPVFIIILVKALTCNKSQHRLRFFKPLKGMDRFVVNGLPVDITDYPYACVVNNMNHLCGGTIINSWTVVTAAHCFNFNDDVDMGIVVHAGSRHRNDDGEADIYYVDHVVIHPDFDKNQFNYDIALIFVEKPFIFGKNVKKAVIVGNDDWQSEQVHKNKPVFTVIGWGMISYNGPLSELGLLMARMSLVSLRKCAALHHGKETKFDQDVFCLYGDGKRDTCKGDSGTGVFWRKYLLCFSTEETEESRRHLQTGGGIGTTLKLQPPQVSSQLTNIEQLVGLVSHGDGCAGKNKPSVYTNVYHFREWIRTSVEQFFTKYCFINNRLKLRNYDP